MLGRLCAIAKKCLSSQIELKLNSFSYSKAGHCKNLSGLTRKICSKIFLKVRPVTLITNIFLKTSEGQLFPERLNDIFLEAHLFMFSGISRDATHFLITVKKNVTGNKLYVLKLPCKKKKKIKLASKLLEIFCKFQAWPNLIYKAGSGMQKKKTAYKTKVCVRLKNSNCFLLFIT